MSPISKKVVSAKVKKKPANLKLSPADKAKLLAKERAERIKEKLSGKNYSPIVAKAEKKRKAIVSKKPAAKKEVSLVKAKAGKEEITALKAKAAKEEITAVKAKAGKRKGTAVEAKKEIDAVKAKAGKEEITAVKAKAAKEITALKAKAAKEEITAVKAKAAKRKSTAVEAKKEIAAVKAKAGKRKGTAVDAKEIDAVTAKAGIVSFAAKKGPGIKAKDSCVAKTEASGVKAKDSCETKKSVKATDKKPAESIVKDNKTEIKNANTPVKRKAKDSVAEICNKKNKVSLSVEVENSLNSKKGTKSILSRKVEVVSTNKKTKSPPKVQKTEDEGKQPTLQQLLSLNQADEQVTEEHIEEEINKSEKKIRRKEKGKVKPISNVKTLRKHSPLSIKRKRTKRDLNKNTGRGVCYFSHIPHGFYADELKKYCNQFGKVTGVYHPVSKNGNSKGYAFVEFLHRDVAQVVAETMNNYLMFNRLVKCELVAEDRMRPWVFRHKKTLSEVATERRERALKARARTLSKEEEEKWHKRRARRLQTLHKKLTALGVDYEIQVNDESGEKQIKSP